MNIHEIARFSSVLRACLKGVQESFEALAAKHVTTGNREENVAEEGRLHPDPLVRRETRRFSIYGYSRNGRFFVILESILKRHTKLSIDLLGLYLGYGKWRRK